MASARATLLFGYYPRNEANDPEIFITGATAMLSSYPEVVVERVCDPIRGLPAKNKFLPSIAEIREFCEREMIWHDAVERRTVARLHTAKVLAKLDPPATPIDRHLVRAEADKLMRELGGATKVEITMRKPRDAREAAAQATFYTARVEALKAEAEKRLGEAPQICDSDRIATDNE